MKITRREVIEAATGVAAVALAAQVPNAQTRNAAVALLWLDGEPPALGGGVTWGVPFPRGEVAKAQTFSLTGSSGQMPLQQWPLAYWPDGSMKFVAFATVVPPGTQISDLRLAPGASHALGADLRVADRADAIEIDTGVMTCTIPKQGSNFVASIQIGGKEVARNGRLICSLEDRADGATRLVDFAGVIRKVVVEQSGPVRSVVKIEGVHKAEQGTREWLPVTLRLYFFAGQSAIRVLHTIVFDGDHEKDFIRGLGLSFAVPMREEVHNRHVRFTGPGSGVWAEPVQPATGRRPLTVPGTRENLYTKQLDGMRLPDKATFNKDGQQLLNDWAVWDSYKLVQPTADGFIIQKRTNPKSCWLDAGWGHRASGVVFAGDVSGGLSAGLKNMWQSHPASLEVHGASSPVAELKVWFWTPDVPAMDLRHYDTKAHGLESSYEDVQEGFSTPHGVARTSEVMLFPSNAVPTREETARQAKLAQNTPLLAASPEYIHSTKVFGI